MWPGYQLTFGRWYPEREKEEGSSSMSRLDEFIRTSALLLFLLDDDDDDDFGNDGRLCMEGMIVSYLVLCILLCVDHLLGRRNAHVLLL